MTSPNITPVLASDKPPAPLIADSAFVQGRAHFGTAMPCQDYALSIAGVDWVGAVVADGCSTGRRTDIGARMWALAAEAVLAEQGPAALTSVAGLAESLLTEADPLLTRLGFDDGLATLGILVANRQAASAVVFGDGVVAQRLRDDRLRVWNVSYSGNAPRYLQYEREPTVLRAWETGFAENQHRVVFTEYDLRGDSPELIRMSSEFTAGAELRAFHMTFEDVSTDTLGLMVMTDGAVSFEGKTPVQGLLPLVHVPNMAGQVTQRRLAALSRSWAKAGGVQGPVDDLAVGAVWLP